MAMPTPTSSPCHPDWPLDISRIERTLRANSARSAQCVPSGSDRAVVQLFQWRGEAFVRLVLDAYEQDADAWLLDRVRFDAVVNAGVWLAEVVDQRNEVAVASRGCQFEHNIGPVRRSMVRGGQR